MSIHRAFLREPIVTKFFSRIKHAILVKNANFDYCKFNTLRFMDVQKTRFPIKVLVANTTCLWTTVQHVILPDFIVREIASVPLPRRP